MVVSDDYRSMVVFESARHDFTGRCAQAAREHYEWSRIERTGGFRGELNQLDLVIFRSWYGRIIGENRYLTKAVPGRYYSAIANEKSGNPHRISEQPAAIAR